MLLCMDAQSMPVTSWMEHIVASYKQDCAGQGTIPRKSLEGWSLRQLKQD